MSKKWSEIWWEDALIDVLNVLMRSEITTSFLRAEQNNNCGSDLLESSGMSRIYWIFGRIAILANNNPPPTATKIKIPHQKQQQQQQQLVDHGANQCHFYQQPIIKFGGKIL
jgi:hypothetical protein